MGTNFRPLQAVGKRTLYDERQREYSAASFSPGKRDSSREPRDDPEPAGRDRAARRSRRPRLDRGGTPIELRTRDRQRKLIAKIDAALRGSKTAPTVLRGETGERSRSSASTRARSPPFRSRPRNATSAAKKSIATIRSDDECRKQG